MSAHPAFDEISPPLPSPVLILCDHASNTVPPSVNGGDLGLPRADMERHIAFDIGADAVARHLAEQLGAGAVMSRFSRLVIDPNRGQDDPTLIMRLYDGSLIPANRDVDATERERRLDAFWRPYHNAISARLDALIGAQIEPVIISVHSFTPQLHGHPPRPWDVGILWDRDDRLAIPLIQALQDEGDLIVGDNEPYSGQLRGDCLHTHGTSRGIAHVLIEIRNDLIETDMGQQEWAARLTRVLGPIVSTENVLGPL